MINYELRILPQLLLAEADTNYIRQITFFVARRIENYNLILLFLTTCIVHLNLVSE